MITACCMNDTSYVKCVLCVACSDRKTLHCLLMVLFKNCEVLLELMVFQHPMLFVRSMHVMNHIISMCVLFSWHLFCTRFYSYSVLCVHNIKDFLITVADFS